MALKVVLDRQPLLGTGPLTVWLRNRASLAAMVALDTFNDNLCLWQCIVVSRGVRIDRSTKAAKALAQQFGRDENAGTGIHELDKVEEFLNQGKPEAAKTGIKVFEPELAADSTIL